MVSILPAPTQAATYYVDASAGNDTWSGRLQALNGSPGTDGPWQTLGRVSRAALVAGDSILLKCGQTWRESLRISASGTASSPITIGRYPAGCSNKPVIDGSTQVPASAWALYAGQIYQAQFVAYQGQSLSNLILNGSLDSSLSGWSKWSASHNEVMILDTDCGTGTGRCMRMTSGTTSTVAISNTFPLNGGEAYVVSFRLRAPIGARVWVVFRRNGPTYETVGLSTTVTGTGSWQTYTFPTSATTTLTNARLDFEVPPTKVVISIDDVQVVPNTSSAPTTTSVPKQVFAGSDLLNLAHHPNRGFSTAQPQSMYAIIAADSDSVQQGTHTGSTYLTYGPDFVLPPGGVITPGMGIVVRMNHSYIDERSVQSTSGNRIYFDRPTTYPILRGWGYYLTNSLWMLDEPGEWFYDATNGILYAWMFDGAAPGDRVSVGHRDYGIDVSSTSYVVIDGIDVRRAGTGIRMGRSTGTQVKNTSISDCADFAIDAGVSVNGTIASNFIFNSARDAITGSTTSGMATGLQVLNNGIVNSGVRTGQAGGGANPIKATAAIFAGQQALVSGNFVFNTGYIGIWSWAGSTVMRNYIGNTCLVLNDCSGIYLNGTNNGSVIAENFVVNVIGNLDGLPSTAITQAQGIYLDDFTSGVTVQKNTVANADHGIQIHNASNNVIQDNTLYGNRSHQIYAQENSNRIRLSGDLFGNQVSHNRLFPTGTASPIKHETVVDNVDSFATYDYNRYSTLLSPKVADELWSTGGRGLTFPEWQSAVTSANIPRNLDPNGSDVPSFGYTTFRVMGSNIVPNGNLASGTQGWTTWNQTPPYGQMTLEVCPWGTCIRYTAGASVGLLATPNFSVAKDQWYRVTFDAKTSAERQAISVWVVRGGGGSNGYESVAPSSQVFTSSTSWKRFSFAFKAIETVNAADPVTLDRGARIDFEIAQSGMSVTIANVELVPISAIDVSLQTRLLINPSATDASIPCPDASSDPLLCTKYVRFSDNSTALWPLAVPAYGSEIVYSRDSSLVDSDGDGIVDDQDQCSATPIGETVNAEGCSLF